MNSKAILSIAIMFLISFSSVAIVADDGYGQMDALGPTITTSTPTFNWTVAGSYLSSIEQLPGFPVSIGEYAHGSPTVVDLDGDGYKEIICTYLTTPLTNGGMCIWNYTGEVRHGWPQVIGQMWGSSPAVADIDDDGILDIIVSNWMGPGLVDAKVCVFHQNGTMHTNWPQTVPADAAWPGQVKYAAPSIGDIDNDGDLEIIVGTMSNDTFVWYHNGTNLSWSPIDCLGNIDTTPALVDIDGDGYLEIFLANAASNFPVTPAYIQAIYHNGTNVTGFPISISDTSCAPYGSLTFGDIDNDGDLEFAVVYKYNNTIGTSLCLYETDGTLCSGFPVVVGVGDTWSGNPSAVSLVDFENDGYLEMVAIDSYGGFVRVVNHTGATLPGWPVAVNASKTLSNYDIYAEAAIGDIDNDGIQDIIIGTVPELILRTSYLYVFNKTGDNITGFPLNNTNGTYGTCVIDDINNDGFLNVVFVEGQPSTIVNVFNFSVLYNPQNVSWSMFRYDLNHSGVYQETQGDVLGPTVTINFAGNLSDSGGPYWRSPGEAVELEGAWSDGYYTNDSRQSEDWIYINLTITDVDNVDEVKLHWLNDTTWTNDSWIFINTVGNFWEFNSSGNITTCEGFDYSFDIWSNDTLNNINITAWNKTGLGGSYTRRYVQLNCTPVNISYTPYYLYLNTTESGAYGLNDRWKEDRMHHDQGPNAGLDLADSGVMNTNVPNDSVSHVYCGGYFGHWFDESVSAEDIELQNIYYHVWQSTKYGEDIRLSYQYGREDLCDLSHIEGNYVTTSVAEGKSTIVYDGGLEADYNTTFTLSVKLLNTNSANFTDNSIYEFYTYFRSDVDGAGRYPYMVSNRSFTSFILFNVPDNVTLNVSHPDTDSDNLSDWEELYVYYTNPFLSDTDNDSATDYEEVKASDYGYVNSDPNNYTNTTDYRLQAEDIPEFISIEDASNGTQIYTPNPTFNWTLIANTSYYQLQIATDSAFVSIILNVSNINNIIYSMEFSSNTTRVAFTLPSVYSLPGANIYYCRVRAFVRN